MTTLQFNVVVDEPMQLGECPLWHPLEEALYWIDIDGRAVHRFIPSEHTHDVWTMPCEPGCIAWCREGGMLVALRTGLALLDTDSGELRFIAKAPYDAATQRFNDGRCDAKGRLWVGSIHEPRDRAGATLYCVERGQIRDANKPVTTSNGVAFSPDSRVLYHADTRGHKITAYDFDLQNGSAGAGRLLKQFSDDRTGNYGGRPDGAAVDSEGAYWCAMYEGGKVLRLSPSGEILRSIDLPLRCPTMIAFGGPSLRTLYITSGRHNRPATELAAHPLSGYVLAVEVDIAGLPEQPYIL
jgi:sugar lactone lactonase YvrE